MALKPSSKNIISKTIFLPANLVVNRSVRNNAKLLKGEKTKQTSLYCPYCAEGKFFLTDKKYEGSDNSVWACNHCAFTVETADDSIDSLKLEIRQNAPEWYAEGVREGVSPLTTEERRIGVSRFVLRSRLYLFLSVLVLLVCIVYLSKGASFLVSLTVLTASFLFFLNCVSHSYSAWKLHNDMLYHSNPKGLLRIWLKKPNIAQWPRNISEHTDLDSDSDSVDLEKKNDS